MDIQTLLLGILAIAIGAAVCFAGYKFFLVLLPLFGFVAGFWLGSAALTELFGGSTSATRSQPTSSDTTRVTGDSELRAILAEAWRRYQAAVAAQRAGDWARYGEEIRRVGELLERLGGTEQGAPR